MNLIKNQKQLWLIIGISVLLVFFVYKYTTDWRWTVPSNSKVIISLERTACFGSCPIYKTTIYENGTVVYEGRAYVGARGIRKANIGADAVQQLVTEISNTGYFLLQDSYNEQMWSDGPTIITYVKIGGKEKQIEHYALAKNDPDELNRLEKLIDDTANSRRWIQACSLWYPSFCSTNIVFWIFIAMPLMAAVSIVWSFIKQDRTRTGIILGGGMIAVIWILVILLTDRHDLFGMSSTIVFYGIIGFGEIAALILLGSFLLRRHKEIKNPSTEH